MSAADAASALPARDLATLRAILLSQEREQLEALQQELEALRRQTGDAAHFLALIEPLLTGVLAEKARTHPHELAEAIRPAIVLGLQRQMQEERESIVALLTPIIGRTVQKAIAEALEALARQIDARMQKVVDFGTLWRRLQNRWRGVDESVALMREALPWQPQHAFLIHNATGLVMAQREAGVALQDPDLVAALLTAIRSFARESFRGDQDDSLQEIQYGDSLILLEEGQHAYLALVGQGIPPAAAPQQMRDQVALAHLEQTPLLRDFQGDPGSDDLLGPLLDPLMQAITPPPERAPVAGLIVIAAALLLLLFGCGWMGYRLSPRLLARVAPTAVLYLTQPTTTPTPPPTFTPTATLTPTPTATPTATPTPSPTATATPTATPTATATPTPSPTPRPTATPSPTPDTAVLLGNVFIRPAPSADAPLSGIAVRRGDTVRIVERRDPWVHIHFPVSGPIEIDGWNPLRWLSPAP